MRKEVLQTNAEQKLLKGMMRNEFEMARKQLRDEVKSALQEEKEKQKKDFENNTENK